MRSDPQAILWDVDGTLVDTAELHYQAWIALAREIGQPFSRADFTATFGWRNPEIIPRLWGGQYSAAEMEGLGRRKEDLYRREAIKGLNLLPGVGTLAEECANAGLPQAIGSSAPRENIELILEMTNLRKKIAAIVAQEDTRRGKPDPEVFLLAAQRLGVDPGRCVVFEDAPVGIRAAKAGGMWAVAVTFVGHHAKEDLIAAGADLVVHSLEEVSLPRLRQQFGITGGS